ncbi:hypothetical protein [Streptomyces sp. enrichment culture]|uniref:hypothetical protein n=1 Tax=Streptomyces sp. enrichment culture TaxID=1795815 RepID=UPI003F5796DF
MTSSTESAPTPSASDAECLALTRQLRRRGTVVLSLFALAWAFAGASGTGPATDMVPVAVEAAALAITAVALYLGLRKDARPSPRTVDLPPNWARGVGIVNGVELLAVVAVIAAANSSGRPAYIPAGIALVVGLHFFPAVRPVAVPVDGRADDRGGGRRRRAGPGRCVGRDRAGRGGSGLRGGPLGLRLPPGRTRLSHLAGRSRRGTPGGAAPGNAYPCCHDQQQ